MRNIVKSFYNYILEFWYQFAAFVFFVLIASALTIGFVSNSLQIVAITSQINTHETRWHYNINNSFSDFNDTFIYSYFQEPESRFFNSYEDSLLNLDAVVDTDKNVALKDVLEDATRQNPKSYNSFVGNWIKRRVFSRNYLSEHEVVLPENSKTSVRFVDFFSIVNKKWQQRTAASYGQVYNLINQDLTEHMDLAYNKNRDDFVLVDENIVFKYQWNDQIGSNAKKQNYSIDKLNLDRANNVVSPTLSTAKLRKMQDNEILVNDKFAKTKGWKIGDTITINDLIVKEEDEDQYKQLFTTKFAKQYKIIGWGMKIQNLFATYDFLNPNRVDSSTETGFFYVTDREFTNYLNYLWFYNNTLIHRNSEDEVIDNQGAYYQRMRVGDEQSVNRFNNYINSFAEESLTQANQPVRSKIRIVFGYDSLYFVQAFNVYLIEGIVFTLIGIISLIFAMLFINYAIKKQLRQMQRQLGLFKSMGYGIKELSVVLWSRTYVLLMVGIILGYAVSVPIQIFVNHLLVPNFYVQVEQVWTNAIFLLGTFIFLPLLLSLINYAEIVRYLHKNTLSMIYMDKNFAFNSGYGYGKTLNWVVKMRSINLGKWHINFSWKQFFMALFIPIFFMFGSLLLMIQFNVGTLMTDTVDLNSHIYHHEMDYSIGLAKTLTLEKTSQQDNDFVINDPNLKNLHYISYNNLNEIINQYHDVELDQAISQYLTVKTPLEKIALLPKILTSNINHVAVNFIEVVRLLNQLVEDYEMFKDQLPILNQYRDVVNQIKHELGKADQFLKQLTNRRVQLTFNNAFIKQGVDFPIFQLELYNNSWKTSFDSTTTLSLVNDENQQIFLNADYDNLRRKSQNLKTSKIIPIVISKQFSKLNNLKVNQNFTGYLGHSNSLQRLDFKVVGINNDKVSNNFYVYGPKFLDEFVESRWYNNYQDNKGKNFLYNKIFSKTSLFNFSKQGLASLTDLKMTNDYFNFYYSTPKTEFSLTDVFTDSANLVDYFNWNNLTTSNFKSIALERFLANKTISDVVNLVYILLSFTLLLLLTLFVVFFIIGTVDNNLQIKLLKSFGYSNSYISIRLLWRYIISITLGLIFAIVVNFFVWEFLINWFFDNFNLLLYSPFNISWTSLSTIIIILLFALGAILAFSMIKKTSPVIKAL